MNDIFISYAREDAKQAERLAKAFEKEGWGVWWDRSLLAGDSFERVIREQLESARCVIVLWSKHSIGSDWVRGEARLGNSRGALVPVLIDESVQDIDIPIEFQGFHTERLTKWKGDSRDAVYRKLTEAVKRTGARPTQGDVGVVGEAPERRKVLYVFATLLIVGFGLGALWRVGMLERALTAVAALVPRAPEPDEEWTVRLPATSAVGEEITLAIAPPGGLDNEVTDRRVSVRITGANPATLPARQTEGRYVARYAPGNSGLDTATVWLNGALVSHGLFVTQINPTDTSPGAPDETPRTVPRERNVASIVLITRSPATVFVGDRRIRTIHGQDTVTVPAERNVSIRLVWNVDSDNDGRPDCETSWDSIVNIPRGQTVRRGRAFLQCGE